MWMNPNNKGYIRATTISSEKFIIIGSKNIELSGNVIINNNLQTKGNIKINGNLDASNVYTKNQVYNKSEIDNSFSNIYTNSLDVSNNVTFRGSTLYVPSLFTIDPFGYEVNTGTVLINGNLVVQGVTTTINSSVVDISDKILVLASNATNSVQADGAGFEISGAKVNLLYNNSSNTFRSSIGMSISGNVVPSTNGVGSLGETGKIWSNAYIRDLSVTNIDVSGNIVPFLDVSCNLGSSLNRWNNIFVNDLSVNNINGLPYSSGGGGGGGGGATDISINGVISISEPSETISKYIQIGRDLDGEYAHNGAFSGWSVSLNNTGDILAIGARRNNGDAVWPYGAGHVKIYKYIDASWIQLGEDINGTIPGVQLGYSVSLNNAGNIIAIGVPSFGPTYNGLVKLYIYNDVSWVQLGRDISGEASGDLFGYAVSLNGIGNIVAIYAPSADGVNGANTGHTRIYKYIDNDWIKLGEDIDGTFESGNYEGELNANISLNTLGNIVAIGGGRANNNIGEVRVFKYNVDSWIQLGSNISGEGEFFGWSVSLNSTGNILAAGAVYNGGNGYASGHVRIYKYNDISWIQLGSDIDGEYEGNMSGHSVSLNDAGTIVAIGARGNRGADSNYIWSGTGHVRVYKYNDISWIQYGVDIDGEAAGDMFGQSVSLNSEGNILAVGAHTNDGNGYNSGSVRVYKFFDILVENKVISSNIVPFTNNIYTLGTSSLEWKNAYIKELNVNTINISGGNIININKLIAHTSNNKITTANRVYQEISGGSNWNAVNGYYGLAKQSFPALNPLTSGVKAIAYWTARHNTGYFDFKNIVWAPKLKMFLTFSDANWGGSGAKYSYDGINWINIFSGYALLWNVRALCWSEELGIFVAGSYRHPYVIYSYNGIEWYSNTTRDSAITFLSICWSPELGIFVAVTESNITGTSTDGINWIGATITGDSPMKWGSVCWAPELGLFVATGFDYQNTNTKVMTSNDGYNWTLRTVPTAAEYPSWVSVCWSPQLGIFVTVASNGGGSNANIMTSTNGIDWIIRGNNNGVSYRNVSWCAELGLFLITQTTGGGSYLYSRNGIDWIEIYDNISETGEWSSFNAYSVVRSPELGIFVAVGGNKIWTSVLKGRPPTSYNVFDSCFNSIDENGNWTFKQITMNNANIVDLSVNLINGQAYNAGGGDVYSKAEIDASFLKIDASLANVYTKNQVYTKSQIDVSFVSKQLFDASFLKIDASLANVYTKNQVYTKSQIDVSFVSKQLFDASINALAASSGGGGGGGSTNLTAVTSNIIPSSTNTYNLGSTSKYWNNAYINNLRVSNRVYQEISGDISWSAVNGYYGLAKDAYPSLNPYSSGDLAVSSWRRITTNSTVSNSQWNDVCWCPELRLFVAVGVKNTGSSAVITSNDGITWTPATITDTSITSTQWQTICWSPQLRLFVAGGAYSGLKLMYSTNGTTWNPLPDSGVGVNIRHMCWSPELSLFVAITMTGPRVATSSNGYDWTERYLSYPLVDSNWEAVCWSPELGLFVAVAYNEIKVMISRNGIDWTRVDIDASVFGGQWTSITWSSQLGIFVAVSKNTGGTSARVMTSRDAITWVLSSDIPESAAHTWSSVCWSPELRIFIGTLNYAWDGSYRILTSVNGINWKFIPVGTPSISDVVRKVTWSPELGVFIALGDGAGSNQINISSLKGRPPTSSNVFNSTFNNIDETGKWRFLNLDVTGTFTNTSDDRLKHNEVTIVNGLEIIDRLTPKFYQKTQNMLDASYNSDLSGNTWSYETGLIAQELLQISDLSFVVSGGDYYEESYIYKRRTNDPSNTNYDPSNANYDICYNLIPQTYNVNYNSIFVYGLAAIKELHAKVKSQETIISSLLTRIEALEANPNSS
uniref:Peptidase S74 domain-containing protein n=1 Tax=viral metagenome TaxID=1070528 RepID=A0A6C0KS22_9ZZZZ